SEKPKVLQELCQKSMILHILEKAFAISEDVSVVLSHQKERVEKEILEHFPKTQILEQDLINFPGTAGALKEFRPKNEKVLILCGDMPLVEKTSLEALLQSDGELSLAVFNARDAKSYGRVIIKDDQVEKIVEFKDANEEEKKVSICNAGVYVIESKLLAQILPLIDNHNAAKEYYLTDSISLAKKQGASIKAVFVDEDEFMGINDKFELNIAQNLMQEKIKKHWMKQGVIFHLPQSTYIGTDVE
ncbi:TPA: NTP transferase domain-containing protein, partial [Campylobacter coli]|nr:NTP transferase domain-containing protein [Campylobacter coli]